MKFCCDNKAAINIVHNLVQHDCTKHVKIVHHFIKEKLEGVVCMPYVPTGKPLADNKGLARQSFEKLVCS